MNATAEQKKALRKIRGGAVAEVARNTLVKGCIKQVAYIQFWADVQMYGLWEALLYAEGYERKGDFAEGTVESTFQAALRKAKL